MQSGNKPFEIRMNDRVPGFNSGDLLLLKEFEPCGACFGRGVNIHVIVAGAAEPHPVCSHCSGSKGRYTGEMLLRRVNYILNKHDGLKPGYVVMAVTPT